MIDIDDVKERLESLNIPFSSDPSSSDEVILTFSIEKITSFILNQTNLSEIPDGLKEVAIDMVVGDYLFVKKGMGQLDIDEIDFSPFAKQIQDGDTNVSFAVDSSSTPEAKFDALIAYFRRLDTDFTKFRVLPW